ncbi:MAG: trypsin-like peptidase domain-containing protein [Bacillota bacterium]|nr:trypsin-like peptidase domain-containing protein [Bacillota bacterium]
MDEEKSITNNNDFSNEQQPASAGAETAAAPAAESAPIDDYGIDNSAIEQTVNDAQPPAAASFSENAQADAQPQAASNTPAAQPTYVQGPKPKKQYRLSGGGIFGLLLLCALLAAAVGFGGGMLAADNAYDDVQAEMQRLMEESGSAVIYRSVQTSGGTYSEQQGLTVSEITDLTADAVVEIVTEVVSDSLWFGQQIIPGAGSGIIISEDGYVLTSNHLIADASTITISLRNGESYEAQLVAADETSDVAILKIEATGLTAVVFGDSDALKVGDRAVAIGNPLGQLGGSVTVGYISALERQVVIDGVEYSVLQTDAAINQGNSGGGLFNAQGELIGLVMAKSSGFSVEGLGFAIPINDITDIVDDLITYGYVTSRVTLGVQLINISDQRTALYYRVDEVGVYILEIQSGSNAEYAGLQVGDRIISIDDTPIDSAETVIEIIGSHSVDEEITVLVDRGGQEISIPVTLYGIIPEETMLTSY